GLPPSLPPLLMAFRLQERAAGVGFDWPDARGPLEKVKEELQELEAELPPEGTPPRSPLPRVAEEIGDLLFAVVNLARKLAMASRMCGMPQIHATVRSTPSPNPACTNVPYFRRSRYQLYASSGSLSARMRASSLS